MVFHAIMKFVFSFISVLYKARFPILLLSSCQATKLSCWPTWKPMRQGPKHWIPWSTYLIVFQQLIFMFGKGPASFYFSIRVRIRENLFSLVVKYRSQVCQKDQLCGWQFLGTWLWRAIGYNLNFQKCHN